MCHGSSLKGGPPVDVGAPPAPDITVYAVPGGWSEAQFVETIRSGTTPYGKALDPEFMPWEVYAKMTDDELAAIRAYMASLGG
jgi:mono/diheme cytochrome c family protein